MSSDFNNDDILRLLKLVLAEPDPTLARLCVQVADYVGAPVASVAHLVELPPHATRTSAMHALVELTGYGSIDLALRLAGHPDPALRFAALESLEDVDDPRVSPALRSLPSDPDPEVQRTLERVCASLDYLDVRRRVPERPHLLTVGESPLARLLVGKVRANELSHARLMRNSDITAVRESAQRYLDARFTDALATWRSNPTVEALMLLENLGDPRVVPYLEEEGLSPDATIGAAQIEVLRSLGDDSAVNVLIKWLAAPTSLESRIWRALADSRDVARPQVARILPALGVERRVRAARIVDARWPEPILLTLLNDSNVEVRLAAVTAISFKLDRHDFVDTQIANAVTALLAGVIARANVQSADDARVSEAARLGMAKVASLGYAQSVIDALDTVLTAKNATHDLLLQIREDLKLHRRAVEARSNLKGVWSLSVSDAPDGENDEQERQHTVTDRVSFSVTSPLAVAPAEIFTLSVWSHTDDQREEVLDRAQRELGQAIRVASRGPSRYLATRC